MIAFEQYQFHLSDLASRMAAGERGKIRREVKLALDGQPGRVLRTLVEADARSAAGAFFTGAKMAQRLVDHWKDDLSDPNYRLYDPACGAGDLLIAAARHLPVHTRLSKTLELWGQRLFGADIHSTFIHSTKARLAILAAERSTILDGPPQLEEIFPGIRVGDFFHERRTRGMTHIAMNPPFTLSQAPRSCKWASGLVNEAGVFLEYVLRSVAPKTKVAALLPEVLRTGSRYEAWRKMVEGKSGVDRVSVVGHFGTLADVDVFALHLERGASARSSRPRWWTKAVGKTVGDFFEVNVGPVVPHRHPKRGPDSPFLDSGSVKPWETVARHSQTRRFKGRMHEPPFVVVRRTSSPSDKIRATASVIRLKKECAVENHLLVLTPKSKKVTDCWKLMRHLRTEIASDWLNKRIRCRHLTVGAIAAMPFDLE